VKVVIARLQAESETGQVSVNEVLVVISEMRCVDQPTED
jgi:hypothetical protein